MRRVPLALIALSVFLAACTAPGSASSSKPAASGSGKAVAKPASSVTASVLGPPLNYAKTAKMAPGPYLAPGSKPGVLPSDLLIADRNNNRLIIINPAGKLLWQFPRPGDLQSGQQFAAPDDAFFTPNGKDIIATEESKFAIAEINVATHRMVWQYGTFGTAGSGPNQLDNPDDAMMLPNGDILAADIINCRILVLKPGLQSPIKILGQPGTCFQAHNPPSQWASPNGVFPMTNGHYIVTEISGDFADELSLSSNKIYFSTNPPGVQYPSDTNQVSKNLFLTADYSNPGQVEEFNSAGQLTWRYSPSGSQALNKPSLALPLPNGDVILNDDWNHRVIVVDPHTNKIVWQYGHTGVSGSGPGYLYKPDGLDLAPPYSLTVSHASTMGLP